MFASEIGERQGYPSFPVLNMVDSQKHIDSWLNPSDKDMSLSVKICTLMKIAVISIFCFF